MSCAYWTRIDVFFRDGKELEPSKNEPNQNPGFFKEPDPKVWKAELAWVAGYVMRQFTCPKAVTHPSTNRLDVEQVDRDQVSK